MTKTIALLPIKANSERVPGKNFRLLGDRPLFRWILDALLDSTLVEHVVINTDAQEQLMSNGLRPSDNVSIRQRPDELLGDFVSMNLIIESDINAYPADRYLMTHVTNPFISTPTIEAAMNRLANSDADSLFSVNRVQTRFYRQDGSAVNHNPDELIRTQDLEPWYEENSCLYLFSAESFRSANARIGKKPIMFVTPPLESIDIDEPEDWAIAEALASQHVRSK